MGRLASAAVRGTVMREEQVGVVAAVAAATGLPVQARAAGVCDGAAGYWRLVA